MHSYKLWVLIESSLTEQRKTSDTTWYFRDKFYCGDVKATLQVQIQTCAPSKTAWSVFEVVGDSSGEVAGRLVSPISVSAFLPSAAFFVPSPAGRVSMLPVGRSWRTLPGAQKAEDGQLLQAPAGWPPAMRWSTGQRSGKSWRRPDDDAAWTLAQFSCSAVFLKPFQETR